MKRSDIARMRPLERKALLDNLAAMVDAGELHLGDAARVLRSAVLGVDRASFARAVGISERTMAKLDDDPNANPTLDTLTRVFAPFGAQMGLVFPRMEPPGPLSETDMELREGLRVALAKSRRRRRRPT